MPSVLTPTAASRGISRVSVCTLSSEPWFSPTSSTSCFAKMSSIGAPQERTVAATLAATPWLERGEAAAGGPRASAAPARSPGRSADAAAGSASLASAGAGAAAADGTIAAAVNDGADRDGAENEGESAGASTAAPATAAAAGAETTVGDCRRTASTGAPKDGAQARAASRNDKSLIDVRI